ncbi:unnamed protein product [Alternaria alternata]
MSTTSSQYRNATQTPSHYQDFPTSNHDPLYGLGSWQQHHNAPSHDSYAAGPSTAQFLHYPPVGVDSAGSHPQSAPTAWAGYVRQAPLEWQHAGPEQNYTARSTVPYCDAEGTASVPHQLPTVSRHYQQQQQQHHSSTIPWPIVDPVEASNVPTVYEAPQNMRREWNVAEAPPEQELYSQHQVPVEHVDRATQLLAQHRPTPKKKAAKVPSSFVERQEKLKVSKRKGPLQERQREKTHTMRKTKRICVRCNGREHQEEAEFLGYDWIHNSQLYEMEIIWNLPGYGPIPNAQPLRIAFRPYSPTRGSLDVATSVWSNRDGQVPSVEQPAYAIYDTANLVLAYERYFSSLQPAIEEWVFARIRQDEVAYHTYQEVVRMRRVTGSKALDLAMRLQCLSVVSQGYGSVFSENIPGIREYDYRRLGRSDYEAYDRNSCDRPLPGAITHQMDVAAVKYLRKLEKLFVKELATLIFKPRIKPWYELFLAFYVIFWNLEYIHHGAQDYIKSKNGTLIENQVSNVVTTQIKKWEFAFPVLLYHWRCILRGYSPFKLARDNPEELRERGHIDAEGFAYVTLIANLFDRNKPGKLGL